MFGGYMNSSSAPAPTSEGHCSPMGDTHWAVWGRTGTLREGPTHRCTLPLGRSHLCSCPDPPGFPGGRGALGLAPEERWPLGLGCEVLSGTVARAQLYGQAPEQSQWGLPVPGCG